MPGAAVPKIKTVYDPAMYPDMPNMANLAANKALTQYQLNGESLQTVIVNGIKFDAPVNMKNGVPYVPTVYPTGVVK